MPLTFAELEALFVGEIEVPVPGKGSLLVRQMSDHDRAGLLEFCLLIPKNERGEIAEQQDAIEFGARVAALSLGAEFDHVAGRRLIARLPQGVQAALIDAAMRVNGLGAVHHEEDHAGN